MKSSFSVSPWAVAVQSFVDKADNSLYNKSYKDFQFDIFCTTNALCITVNGPKNTRLLFLPAYSPDSGLLLKTLNEQDGALHIKLQSAIGKFDVTISWPEQDFTSLRYTTCFMPASDMFIPFWPKDVVINGENSIPEGDTLVQQVGTRSGMLYCPFTKPRGGSFLYLQNLTALADYCQLTETSVAASVTSRWPEMGFSLPPAIKKPLPSGKKITISDAIVVLDPNTPKDEGTMTRQFLDMLANAYLIMPRPETKFHDWPDILGKGLKDLLNNSGCWSHVKGREYFNAYVSDYKTPPEIMVQLAVILPLLDYQEWNGQKIPVINEVKNNLSEFYDPKLKTITRWLPAAKEMLDGGEEQKNPNVMDSWYLHHPLLNLSRLAIKGDEIARKLFFGSIDYAIKVARKFKYQWPVFYQMETLEVIKPETVPGKGGEKDVPGAYAHVMLQAYELTKDKRYLKEAEKAAKTLKGLGFELFYQANNTAFSAGAMIRLYKLTGEQDYLDLSYLCLANIFRNCRLWDCNYGYGKYFPSFFTLFPLNDAPYTAVYEEQEVFCALRDYLRHSEGTPLLPSAMLLICEYVRYMVNRAAYYYPPMLPSEMLEDKQQTGELDPKLWIALEDLHDGWEKCGKVGQEVYGAGNAFGILPRLYYRISGDDWLIGCDYPIAQYKCKGKKATFHIQGDSRLICRLVIVPNKKQQLPGVTIRATGRNEPIEGNLFKDGHSEYSLPGNQDVEVSW
ncbi:MAG: hypothetical protein JO080_09050 [Mucilaginibacter sp.]|nr:hypothetical protein [Mucilaginibacter sp.]